jgi:hypothetical protein
VWPPGSAAWRMQWACCDVSNCWRFGSWGMVEYLSSALGRSRTLIHLFIPYSAGRHYSGLTNPQTVFLNRKSQPCNGKRAEWVFWWDLVPIDSSSSGFGRISVRVEVAAMVEVCFQARDDGVDSSSSLCK